MSTIRRCVNRAAEFFATAIITGGLAGCGSDSVPLPSASFPTSSIYAYMKAVQDESGRIATTVQLRDGNTTDASYLFLSSGETLLYSVEKSPQDYLNFSSDLFGNALDLSQHLRTMAVRDLFIDFSLFVQVITGKPEYFATSTPTTGVGRAFVDMRRADASMVGTSSIDLPGPFQISAPASAGTFSRAAPLTLSWTNPDATTTMSLDVAGVCDDGNRYSMTTSLGADTGTATLSSADYFPATGVSATANCLTAFILQRQRMGVVSPNFAFGSFTGAQQRKVQFSTTP